MMLPLAILPSSVYTRIEVYVVVFITYGIILASILTGYKNKDIEDTIFVIILSFGLFNCIAGVGQAFLNGKPGYQVLQTLLVTCYGFMGIYLLGFAMYMASLIREKNRGVTVFKVLIAICCITDTLLYIINNFVPIIYIFDEAGVGHQGPLYIADSIILFIGLALTMTMILINHRSYRKSDIWLSFFFPLFPCIALVLFIIFPYNEFDFFTVALCCSILSVYVSLHTQRKRKFIQNDIELTEARVNTMVSQIEPHFIYNALGTIQFLYETKNERANDIMDAFCKHLRGNIDLLGSTKLVPFIVDRKQVEYYIKIETERFPNINLEFILQTEDFQLPFGTLEPLVENAVKYGLRQKENGGTITISTIETSSDIMIIVTDNGYGFDTRILNTLDQEHSGILNVKNRLRMMCHGKLELSSTIGVGTTIVITIPKQEGVVL